MGNRSAGVKKLGYNNHPLIVINLTWTDVIAICGLLITLLLLVLKVGQKMHHTHNFGLLRMTVCPDVFSCWFMSFATNIRKDSRVQQR